VDEAGMATFNKVWTSPQTLPTREELSAPRAWLERVGNGAAGPDELYGRAAGESG
jgi:hypothetical protein